MKNKSGKTWVEIFNFPRHKNLDNEDPDRMLRIPNHTFMKIDLK